MSFHVIGLMLLFISCKDSAPEPSTITPGKRDYTWTRDTIQYPGSFQTTMESIYGTSDSNVYVVGHNELGRGKMYRYNGMFWQVVPLTIGEGGPITGGIQLTEIHGSVANNIWAVGRENFLDPISGRVLDSSLVIHFDGMQWRKAVVPRSTELWSVWVLSATSVWAGSSSGAILQLNGTVWTKYELGKQYFFSSIAAISPNEVYVMGHVDDFAVPVDSSGSFLFKFDGAQWKKIDSVMRTPSAPPPHMGIAVYSFSGILYSAESNVYRRSGTSWTKLVDAQVGSVWQSSSNNIIAVGRAVWHFNGFDWQQYHQFSGFSDPWYGCYTDGNEVFAVGNDNSKTFILHGK